MKTAKLITFVLAVALTTSAFCQFRPNVKGSGNVVTKERKAGYFRETESDAVMEKVDEEGNIIGFSILKVSALKPQKPLSVSLKSRVA